MINIKKTFLLSIIVSISTLFFAGCGTPKVPDINQMTEDLIATNSANFDITYQYDSSAKKEFFDVNSVELVKRKTDEDAGIDTVYVIATLDNEYYTASANYTLTYNLYDEGGWILDEFKITDYSIFAKSNPIPEYEISLTRLALRGKFHEAEITDNRSETKEDGQFCNTLSFEGIKGFSGITLYTTGTYSFIFEDGVWYEEYHIDSVQYDLSPMLGTWVWTGENYDDYLSITIEDLRIIDEENAEITYSYYSSTTNNPNHVISENNSPTSTKTIRYFQKNRDIFEDTYSIPNSFSVDVVLGQPISPTFQDRFAYWNDVNVTFCIDMEPFIYSREGAFTRVS